MAVKSHHRKSSRMSFSSEYTLFSCVKDVVSSSWFLSNWGRGATIAENSYLQRYHNDEKDTMNTRPAPPAWLGHPLIEVLSTFHLVL